MRQVLIIAGKELRSYFVSPVAYVIAAFWLVGTGIFFYFATGISQDASMRSVFNVVLILLLLISPALTMRLLAEETRTGTGELLLTAPIKDWAVVLGKFVGVTGLYIAMVALTLLYPLLIVLYKGNPDWGPIFSGYLGLILLGMSFLAVGLFASALTSNQMVSAVIGFVLLLLLFVVGNLSTSLGGPLGDFLGKLSVSSRYDPFQRGVVDLRDVVFYLSLSAVVLFLTIQVVEARRYRS